MAPQSTQWIAAVAAIAFVAIVLLVVGLSRVFAGDQEKRRLRGVLSREGRPAEIVAAVAQQGERPTQDKVQKILATLSRLSVPEEGWQNDAIRLKLLQAAMADSLSPQTYYALKTLLAIVLPLAGGFFYWLSRPADGLLVIAGATLTFALSGYYGPEYYLKRRSRARVDEMRDALPDVIDLLVICTESGLSLDQALSRVAQEVARNSPMVASEFHVVTLEIRAGAGRSQALRNLALRVDLDDLSNLASMLIQADRFGTGIAEALRVQSELMRLRRMQRAEEMAAKIPTKMLVPLIFMVFPALMIVILGPAIIRLNEVFAETASWH